MTLLRFAVRVTLPCLLLLALLCAAAVLLPRAFPGAQLAYTSNRDGDSEIYLLDVRHGMTVQLTDNPTWDCCASWSPDGRYMAFSRLSGGEFGLFVYDWDTGRVLDVGQQGSAPAWSPDGRQIAFQSGRAGSIDLWVMNVAPDGTPQGDAVRLTAHVSDDTTPAWSPDGTLLAFASLRDGNAEIYLLTMADAARAPDTGVRRMTTSDLTDKEPAFSSDGRSLYYLAGNIIGNWRLYRMPLAGGDGVLVAPYLLDEIAWTPDERLLAFTGYQAGNPNIYVLSVPADGVVQGTVSDTQPVNLTPGRALELAPAWRP